VPFTDALIKIQANLIRIVPELAGLEMLRMDAVFSVGSAIAKDCLSNRWRTVPAVLQRLGSRQAIL